MGAKFHGVSSISLIGVSTLIAGGVLFQHAGLWGIGYLALAAAAAGVIVYAFCAKCVCKTHCGHVFPGKLASLIKRAPGPYTNTELAALVLALGVIIGLPQIWLWRNIVVLIVYWALNIIALIQISNFVCRACDNVHCPIKMMEKQQTNHRQSLK